MLKFLMDAIETIEKEHVEPHETSFIPRAEQIQVPNGTAGHANLDVVEPVVPPGPRTSSFPKSGIFGQRTTNEQRPGDTPSIDTEINNLGRDGGGYLPCHYFDYIAGTSTGGWVPSQVLPLASILFLLTGAQQAQRHYAGTPSDAS
jgi:hypothetical protein